MTRWCIYILAFFLCYGVLHTPAATYPGPAGTIRLENRTFGSVEFVPLLDLANALGMTVRWYYEPRKIEMRNNKMTIDFSQSSRFVLIDKVDFRRLEAAPVFVQGEPFVPASFLTDLLRPYFSRLRESAEQSGRQRIVVLDPGHGGRDHGATANGLREKELVLDLAQRVRRILIRHGVKVILTRERDVFVPLIDRADVANEVGAAAFVSIHANSVVVNPQRISGTETYYLATAQTASARETERIENSVIKYEVESRWATLNMRMKRMFLRQHFQRTRTKSISLAQKIQSRLGTVAVGKDRGIKPANFSVLRNVYAPAVLVEVGFLTHNTDAAYLARDDYRDRISNAIAQGILEFLNTPTQ